MWKDEGRGNKCMRITEETEFYAISQEIFRDQEEPFAAGILFEIVAAEDINVFLGISEDMGELYGGRGSEACGSAIEAFRKEGLLGEDFGRVKFSYLAETSFYQFLWYLDETEIPLIPLGQWYRFAVNTGSSEERPGDIVSLEGLEKYPDTETRYQRVEARLLEIPTEIQEKLTELYRLPAMTAGISEGDTPLGLINTAIIQDIQVLNMGQALCVAIRDNTGRPLVFFDFGLPTTANHAHQNHAPQYQDLSTYMQNIHGQNAIVDVVLSHWHGDHVMAAVPLSVFMGNTIWHVPNLGQPTTGTLINAITQNGTLQNVHTYSGAFSGTALGGHQSFLIGKIDMAGLNAAANKHHHGMYAQVRTTGGGAYFLCGDTTYAELPDTVRQGMGNQNGYKGLQACHHGGDYSMHPAVHDSNHIPLPAASPAPPPPPTTPKVVYSCGVGNSYGHPEEQSVTDHANRGWTFSHKTDTGGGITMT